MIRHRSQYGSAMDHDLAWMDATALAALVADGSASPIELVDDAIARIEKLNPTLNAVVIDLFDRARSRAVTELGTGPFRGVPFLLKDFLAELEGTTFVESTSFAGEYRSTHTQELAARYERAGFVICGKTNAPEFAILPTTEPKRWGPSKNPWDTTRTTGGSSGGTGAAVAAGMVPVAHGNDGGGSIRIPASCCGLVGMKPTRGRVSLAPSYGDVMGGLVCEHVLTRSVRDSAAILDATHGPMPGDPYAAPPLRGSSFLAATTKDPARLRLAILTDAPNGVAVDPECVAAVQRAAALCEQLGHHTEATALAVDGDAFVEHFINVWAAGNASGLLGWEQRVGRTAKEDDFEPLTWALCEFGRSIGAGQYLSSMGVLQRITRQIATALVDVDVLVTPTLAELPVPLGTFDSPPDEPLLGLLRSAAFTPFTPVFNVTGQPAVSLPLSMSESGLPIGVQFAGRLGDEETLFALAAQLERAAPWADRRPQVSA